MGTIASLIVEIAGDNTKLRRTLNDSQQITSAYRAQIRQAQTTFAQQATAMRENLFRGALSPAEFARQGALSAKAYNDTILTAIGQLRDAGKLTNSLHARLVLEMKETGLAAGQALGQGVAEASEGTGAALGGLQRRFQSTGVSIAFAMEAMANGTETGSKRALRSIALLAFAFGPEVGGITLAITTATQFMLDFFHKARAEAEKTMLQFHQHLAEMARAGPGGFIQAAQAQQAIHSGDPFATIEGKRKDETDAEFEARKLGILGVTAALATMKTQLDKTVPGWHEFTDDASGKIGRVVSENMAGQAGAAAKLIGKYSDLKNELKLLQEREKALAPVLALTTKAESDAAQNTLDEAARKQAVKDAKVDQVKKLEEQLSQVIQTRDAMVKLGESASAVADVTRGRLVGIFDEATTAWAKHAIQVDAAGVEYDKLSPRLKRVADEMLHLQEVSDKAAEALIGTLKLSALKGPQLTTTGVGQGPIDILRTTPLTKEQVEQRAFAGINTVFHTTPSGFGIGGPQVAPLPTTGPGAVGPGVGQARIDLAQAKFAEVLASVGGTIKSWASSLASLLNPVAIVSRIFEQFASSFLPVLEPLQQVFSDLAAVVARDLAPIFKAFEPVLRALIPVVDDIMRVLTPIIVALAPMFGALVPIIKALLPVIKLGAIVSTYLFQAFALGASIFLKAVGNIIVGWGTIMKALATAIDKLPFVSAKGAINAAQGIIDFGNALVASGGDFKQAADAMAKARDDINAVTFDDTAGAVKGLGEAATETADALKNVPTWWRASLAVFQATNVRGGGAGISPNIPPTLTPSGIGSQLPVPTVTTGGTGALSSGALTAGTVQNVTIEKVEITDQLKSGKDLVKEAIAEARRISQATFGTTSRWAEVI